MSLFEKMDPSFFTILVSKNRDIYVDLLLQIHDCIYRNQTMSMERALLQDLLEDYVQDKKYEIDFQEEAEYSDIENELRSEKDVYDRDIQFLLRLFEKHTWINVDLHMDTMKKMVSLPYHSRVFISFVNDIIKEREQIGYLIRIHASLKDMDDPVKIEDSYQHIRNAYADFKELILTLEQTNARIRDYYAIQVKKASTKIYHDFFDVYYGDIVEGYVFPTLVEDSLKRFKNPVAGILETLLQEEAVKEKIVDSAVSHYRVASRDTAKKHIEEMLYAMYNDLNIVETLTAQLVDSDAGYRRLAKQKIMYPVSYTHLVIQNTLHHLTWQHGVTSSLSCYTSYSYIVKQDSASVKTLFSVFSVVIRRERVSFICMIAALYLTASSFCLSSHLSTRCPLGMNVSSCLLYTSFPL